MNGLSKKSVKLVLGLLLVVESCFLFLTFKSFSDKNIEEIKEEYIVDKKLFAMYTEQEDGSYKEYNDSNYFPNEGYKFNSSKSNCVDNKGKKIDGVLTRDSNKITVSSNKTTYCYIYFDIDTTPINNGILINLDAPYATSTSVTLTLSSTGASEMCISNTSECTSWETYATSKSHTLETGDGTKTVYVWYRDIRGNETSYVTDTIVLDTTAPTDNSVSINSGATYSTSKTVTLTLSSSGASEMCISESTSCSSYISYTASYNYTFTSDGTKTIYVWYKDESGNVTSTYVSDSIIVDSAAPTSNTVSINSGATYTNTTSVKLTLSSTDATSGVSTMCISNSSTCTNYVSYATSYTHSLSTGNGTKTVYVYFKDKAGNVSSVTSDSIIYDGTTPTVTMSVKEKSSGTAISSGSWANEGLNFTLTNGTVGTSGATIYYCKDTANTCTPSTKATSGTAITSYNTVTGTYYIRYKIVSNAGLSSSVASYTAKVDTTAPVVTATGASTGVITISITESGSGVSGYCVNSSSSSSGCTYTSTTSKSFTVTKTTSGTYYVHIKDSAGNVGSSSAVTITLGTPGSGFVSKYGSNTGFVSTAYNGMYRFTGKSANNYASIGGVLYRIIGITSTANSTLGLDAGQYKVIKAESIGTNKWHTSYSSNTIWTSSAMYTYLQGSSVLGSTSIIPSGWSNRIDSVKWYIGDGSSYTNASTIVGYEDNTITSSTSKIGLMYLSDYYYANTAGGTTNCYTACSNWMTLGALEWTMTRWGYYSTYGTYYAHYLYAGGYVRANILTSTAAVRPVFYLNSDVIIKSGTGTSSNPFIMG